MMIKEVSLRTLSIILLLLNGIPALLAGGSLISDPTGAGLKMELSLLEFSPFKTFLIPGLILFTMNGIFSIITLIVTLLKKKYYPSMIIFQGLILTGWITVQIVMIMESSWMQLMYGFVGLALMTLGMSLEIIQKRSNSVKELLALLTTNSNLT